MKLLLIFSLGLLALSHPVLCWPVDEDRPFEMDYPSDLQQIYDSEGDFQQEDYNGDVDTVDFQDEEPQLSQQQMQTAEEDHIQEIHLQGGQGEELPKDAANELRKQMGRGNLDEADVEATSSKRSLRSGCTVALQLLQNNRWLSCRGANCVSNTCPGRFFSGRDNKACWGEAFKMYNAAPRKNILSGDFVGLHYPRQNKWFSVQLGRGHKSSCPGRPSTNTGFQNFHRWFTCAGEVFQVYAMGKRVGAPITDQDTIALYHPGIITNNYVQFLSNRVGLSKCLLQKSADRRPPTPPAFDVCINDSVEITIFD